MRSSAIGCSIVLDELRSGKHRRSLIDMFPAVAMWLAHVSGQMSIGTKPQVVRFCGNRVSICYCRRTRRPNAFEHEALT